MHRFFPIFVTGQGAVGLLILRLVTGMAFMLHGWPKVQNPFGWMGHSDVPGSLQALAALSEFGGGLGLMLGLLTPLAALGIVCTMIAALAMVHLPLGHPFVSNSGQPSFELATGYLGCMILLLLIGPGVFSLDSALFGNKRQSIVELWNRSTVSYPHS